MTAFTAVGILAGIYVLAIVLLAKGLQTHGRREGSQR